MRAGTLRRRPPHRRDHRRGNRRPDHRRRKTAPRPQKDHPTHATNPLGVHALVWAGDTTPASVDARHHRRPPRPAYDLLEISLHDSLNLDIAAARSPLQAAGLEGGLLARPGLRRRRLQRRPRRRRARRQAAARLPRASPHELGGTHFTGALYSALGKYSRPLSAAGRANVVSVLRPPRQGGPDQGHDPRPGDLQPVRDQRHQHRRRTRCGSPTTSARTTS